LAQTADPSASLIVIVILSEAKNPANSQLVTAAQLGNAFALGIKLGKLESL
jgi:hypothetical protein